jgi:hypothetical protein
MKGLNLHGVILWRSCQKANLALEVKNSFVFVDVDAKLLCVVDVDL